MSCETLPTIAQLEITKLLTIHFAELNTSRAGGVPTGAVIEYSTNPVTGEVVPTYAKNIAVMEAEHDAQISAHELEHDNQISAHEVEHDAQIAAHEVEHDNQMQSFETDFDGRLAGMAFTRVGSFTAGATLTDMRQVLVWEVSQGGDGHEYGWSGVFPKVVAAGATPATSGGIAVGAWMSRFDPELKVQVREALRRSYAEAGYNLVDGSFEAGGTLVNANDVLLQESSGKAYSGPVGPVSAGTNPTSAGFVDRSNDIIRRYTNIESMAADPNIVVGNELSTGGSKWRAISTTTPLALQNGLYAELVSDLYISDFASNHIQQLNAYITAGMSGSYATRALAEAYKYSMKPVTVVFNIKVTSPVPLLLMHHVKYQRVGPGMYFSRAMKSGLHYAPSNLDSCATEPVVFELSGGSFVRKTGPLIGTPDNPVLLGDANYITMSGGCDVSFDVTTATGVKLGFNFSCCPGITGDRPSMGVAEQDGDAISVPKVAMFISRSWTHSINNPMLRSSQQSIVYSQANAGGKVTQPYCQRDGTMISTAVPYSFAEAVSAGKNGSTAITILGSLDFTIDTPILENWKYPISAKDTDVRISEPHIEGDVAEHNVVVLNSYIDIDNWSGMLATGTGVMLYSLDQDGADRAVILRGMPMRLGPVNGIVGGTYSRAFLIIEDISGAVTDYGKMGDWAAIRRLNLSIQRSIYVDAVAGSDTNTGLASTRPVKTMSTAIRILNTVNRMAPAHAVTDINLKSDVTIDTVTRAYKPFTLWGAFTLTAQAAAYIELYNCGMVQLRQPTINAAAAAVIRHVAGNNTILCDSSTLSGVAIAQTSGAGSMHMSVTNAVTTGIAKYLDGPGSTALSLIVNGGSRNTAIDANPTGIAQLVLGTKYV